MIQKFNRGKTGNQNQLLQSNSLDKGQGEGSVKETNLVNETMSMGENFNNAAGLLPNPTADPQTGMRGLINSILLIHGRSSKSMLFHSIINCVLSTDMEALQNLTAECDLDSKQGSDYGDKEVVEGNVLMLEWLAGWFLCVSVLAVVLLYLEVSCWLCCLYAHLNFMSRLNFVGGPKCWNTRTFSASAGGEAFCNGQTSHVSETDRADRSLLVTEFGYEHDDAWATNIYLNNLLISAGIGGVKPASRRPVAVAKTITGSLVLRIECQTPELHELLTVLMALDYLRLNFCTWVSVMNTWITV
ncbi:hypothetical protein C5167_038320 [Papaver somniferum]|uniref:Uncharacterized protein n=1 Tax=Papaver somniferum TaxID=3469 RepID=A0A4Y7IC97_PAPSO|nr:hypothetical protein C5167_038320 [Papaver somniferum]